MKWLLKILPFKRWRLAVPIRGKK